MDLTQFFQNPTIENKKYIYANWFSSGTNTTCSFKDKLELYTLICYLTQQMKAKDPIKYGSALKVLTAVFKKDFSMPSENGEDKYIVGLSIICDDLLWGTEDPIPAPTGYKNGNEIVLRIKQLVEQWLPF